MADQRKFYTPEFYREIVHARQSADEVLPIVFDLLRPKSIVDIGCGVGHWLAAAMQFGVEDILGVDGEWARQAGLVVPREKFFAHDLTLPLVLKCKFDLALSLEVAEHLPESKAQQFVQTLCDASHRVLFSAAIPGQGGRYHVNEQWPSYWAGLFKAKGYVCFDLIRPQIWNNPKVTWYYAQNMLLFVSDGILTELEPTGLPLSQVHPQLWSAQVEAMSSPGKLLEKLINTVLPRGRRRSIV